MSPTTVAIFGYGFVGKSLVQALLDVGANVVVFSRDASKLDGVPPEATKESADYTDEAAVTALLKRHQVDVVACPLAGSVEVIAKTQVTVARAAKAAGAKLFLPNEFGLNPEGHTTGVFGAKSQALSELATVGVPTLRVIVSASSDTVAETDEPSDRVVHRNRTVLLSSDVPGKLSVVGKGDTKVTFTSLGDVAGESESKRQNAPH